MARQKTLPQTKDKPLVGYDLDVTSLMFYRNIKVAATNNAPGARTIYEDLKRQFFWK